MTTAFVLSGGGNLGAVQAGQLRALIRAGVRPDLVVGASVGAINGAFVAGACHDHGCTQLADTWARLRRSDVFPTSAPVGLRGVLGQASHLVSSHGLRRLLDTHLRFTRLEDAPIPLHVVTCDVRSGAEVVLTSGPATEAICASAAIPGVFAPVAIGEHVLIDGGIVNNAPLSHAVATGADDVWVLACGYACALAQPPRTAAAIALQALALLVHQRLAVDVVRYRSSTRLRLVPTLCPLNVGPTDFAQSVRLLDAADIATRSWLDSGAPDLSEHFAFPHRH